MAAFINVNTISAVTSLTMLTQIDEAPVLLAFYC